MTTFSLEDHPAINEEEREFLKKGQVINAIKSYRGRNYTIDETGAERIYSLYDAKMVMETERALLPKDPPPPWASVDASIYRPLTAEERALFPALTEDERLNILNGHAVRAIKSYRERMGTFNNSLDQPRITLSQARAVIEHDRDHIQDERSPEERAEALAATVRDIVRGQAKTLAKTFGFKESDILAQFVYEANVAYREAP